MKNTLILASMAALLTACGGDNNSSSNSNMNADTALHFSVKVVNLSYAQPFSPLGVFATDTKYQAWAIGSAASNGLEQMAEGGDNTALLADAANAGAMTLNGAELITPGMSGTYELVTTSSAHYLGAATMLVNTNDAFAGVQGIDLSTLAVGDSISMSLPVYDAGTEANSEASGTIPGPADGGTGYDAVRDDVDYVARHPGVVTAADGYAESTLDESHRFDAPIGRLVVTRTR